MNPLKQRIVDDYTRITGPNDEPEIYGGPPGDPGLVGPGSVSWEIHSDVAAVGIAGTAAIIMEILHPSVMAGVHDLSSYRTHPLRRARRTAGYVMATTFGNTEAAEGVIAHVRAMHGRVNGLRPDGVAYRAMDPTLLGWVHTAIPWAVMLAFERYTRPLSEDERNRYLAEQAVIGYKGGAGPIPETTAELDEYTEAMRPQLAITEQTREFFEFLLSSTAGVSLPGPLARPSNLVQLHASMSIMPAWARRLVGFEHSDFAQSAFYDRQLRLTARTLRWAFGVPPFRAMAEARAAGAKAPPPAVPAPAPA